MVEGECATEAEALRLFPALAVRAGATPNIETRVLQVGRLQPRMLGNPDQHARADFFLIVECPDVIRKLRLAVTKLDV